MTKNKNLTNAKKVKNDEFYTLISDIEKEVKYYKKYFEGKVVVEIDGEYHYNEDQKEKD